MRTPFQSEPAWAQDKILDPVEEGFIDSAVGDRFKKEKAAEVASQGRETLSYSDLQTVSKMHIPGVI